jgi:hypothetical protein
MQRNGITIDDMMRRLGRIEADPANGWIGNVSDALTEELHRCDLVWRDGEYLRLSDRGEELLELITFDRLDHIRDRKRRERERRAKKREQS